VPANEGACEVTRLTATTTAQIPGTLVVETAGHSLSVPVDASTWLWGNAPLTDWPAWEPGQRYRLSLIDSPTLSFSDEVEIPSPVTVTSPMPSTGVTIDPTVPYRVSWTPTTCHGSVIVQIGGTNNVITEYAHCYFDPSRGWGEVPATVLARLASYPFVGLGVSSLTETRTRSGDYDIVLAADWGVFQRYIRVTFR